MVDTTGMSEPERPFQFSLHTLLMVTVVISVIMWLWLWLWLIAPSTRHQAVSDKMEIAILSLATKRPRELTADQWAHCVTWTWNLHCNFGQLPYEIPTNDLDQIASGLQERVEQGPDLATIDWVWDQYMESCPSARNCEHWRPTAPDNRDAFQVGYHGVNALARWKSDYKRRVAQRGG